MIKLDCTIHTDKNRDYFYKIWLERWEQRVSYSEMTQSKLIKVDNDRFKNEEDAKEMAEKHINSIYQDIYFYWK